MRPCGLACGTEACIAVARARCRPSPHPPLLWRPPALQDKIDECIAKLEAVGAIQACADQANDMVDAAWDNLDRCLPDSFYKVVLRSFSWYLIQRHY